MNDPVTTLQLFGLPLAIVLSWVFWFGLGLCVGFYVTQKLMTQRCGNCNKIEIDCELNGRCCDGCTHV